MTTTPVIKRKRVFTYKTIRNAEYIAEKIKQEANKKQKKESHEPK